MTLLIQHIAGFPIAVLPLADSESANDLLSSFLDNGHRSHQKSPLQVISFEKLEGGDYLAIVAPIKA